MSQLVSKAKPVYAVTEGQGRPILVLHGWGMNQAVWQPIRERLNAQAQVTWVDLPGHGQSPSDHLGSIEHVIESLTPLLQPNTCILGWSLGGLIAQALAYAVPNKVERLVLVGTSPCFVQQPDWASGLAPQVLQQFADNLQQHYKATVKRFFALQFMGTRQDPAQLNALRDSILAHPSRLPALQEGLELLRNLDFANQTLTQPSLWILGRLDKLIPVAGAEDLRRKGYGCEVMPHASHVPFVTHTDEFMALVEPFLHE